MESIIIALLPYLDAGGSIALMAMLAVAWKIYQRIGKIELDIAVTKTEARATRDRVDRLDKKVFNGGNL